MNIIFNAILLTLVFVITSREVSAYLDPGTGSFIFQLIVGALLGGIFTIKIYFKKIKLFFVKLFTKKNNDQRK